MDCFSSLKKLASSIGISIQLYKNETLIDTTEIPFLPNPAYYYVKPYIHIGRPLSLISTQDALLCGYIEIVNTDYFLCIGPAVPFEYTINQARSILCDMDISDAHTGELLSACYEYPRMNTDMFANFLEFVAEFVNPDQKDLKIQISNKYNLFDVKDSKDLDTDEENSALEIENQMMDMIKYGKIDELRQFLQTSIPMRSLSLPMLTPSTIRSAKNILIASSSLASRVAVSQGVDYDTAVSLSDYYIHRVESLNNYNDIIALISTMQLDYTTRIATVLHPHSESYLINQIYDYVASHLHERISTKDVADALSMNGSYLTKIFRQETGQSIMEYIHKQKIREACYLLESSNLNYVVIADKLGYSSQQHFQKVFKSVMNMTPGKYRSLNSDHDIV